MQPESNTALESLCKSIQTFGSLTMAAENRDKLYRYNDALMQSLYSILEDSDCDETVKMQYFNSTMEQYTAAMKDLFPKLISAKPPQPEMAMAPMLKADPNRYDEIVEVEKFNPYHDNKGRFASASGYASFTYAPGKSKAHDNAIAREKERQAAAGGASGDKKEDAKPQKPSKKVEDFNEDRINEHPENRKVVAPGDLKQGKVYIMRSGMDKRKELGTFEYEGTYNTAFGESHRFRNTVDRDLWWGLEAMDFESGTVVEA